MTLTTFFKAELKADKSQRVNVPLQLELHVLCESSTQFAYVVVGEYFIYTVQLKLYAKVLGKSCVVQLAFGLTNKIKSWRRHCMTVKQNFVFFFVFNETVALIGTNISSSATVTKREPILFLSGDE